MAGEGVVGGVATGEVFEIDTSQIRWAEDQRVGIVDAPGFLAAPQKKPETAGEQGEYGEGDESDSQCGLPGIQKCCSLLPNFRRFGLGRAGKIA